MNPIAWNDVCTSKKSEGLAIRNLEHLNDAYLAKLGWKILTDHNNWLVQIVRRKYLHKEN